MSLVVTSNIASENDPDFSNAFKPYSYQNRLLNTMKIPANSEIALQSAKINKNGLFVLDRANSGFCHYFGTRIGSDADIPDLSYSTTQPFRAVIGAGESFRAGEKSERNVEDMANDLQKGLNQATFHPSLINGTSTTTNIVQTENASDTTAFQGFRFTATQQTAKTQLDQADVVWTDINRNNAYGFSQGAGVATAVDNDGFILQSRQYPISQNDGHVSFDISGCNSSNNTKPWAENPIGISAILIAPPCPRRIDGRGLVTDILVEDPGNGYTGPDEGNRGYPALIKLKEVLVKDPGINYNCGVDELVIEPSNGAELDYECDTFGRIVRVKVLNPGIGFTEYPTIRMPSNTGVNFKAVPLFDVERDPVAALTGEVPLDKLVQVTDLVGLKQTGYVDGRAYYGAVFYKEGVRYAGYFETAGQLIQVYDTLQESIDAEVTTAPSAIQRQGTDTNSNNPRLDIPGTPDELI